MAHHVAPPADATPPAAVLPPQAHALHPASQPSHLGLAPTANPIPANTSHQQELQAKILSLFNSGSGSSGGVTVAPQPQPQPQSYSSLSTAQQSQPRPAMSAHPQAAPQGYGTQPGRMPMAPGGQRPPSATSGINFDNPSVQKALDTLIQSGPALNHLVGSAASQQPVPRTGPSMGPGMGSGMGPGMGPGMGQQGPMPMYPRHY